MKVYLLIGLSGDAELPLKIHGVTDEDGEAERWINGDPENFVCAASFPDKYAGVADLMSYLRRGNRFEETTRIGQ